MTPGGLTLLSSDAARQLVHFDFSSSDVAVDGTSDSFVICDKGGTALHISATNKTFHQAIFDNHKLRSAAHRAANVGPFVASSQTGDPIRIEAEKDVFHLIFGSKVDSIPITRERIPRLEWQDAAPRLKLDNVILSAQLPMLEGISAAALTSALIPRVRADFRGCLSTVVGLEGKYFAYSVLGKLAESHLSLAAAVETQPFNSISSMAIPYEQNVFVAFIMRNAGILAADLSATSNYLPAFAVARDIDLLTHIGLPNALNARNVEQAYQRALGSIGPLISLLYRLDGHASRLTSMQKALAKEEGWSKFLPLGVSAAASLVNPYALVGVAQQGASLFARSESRSTLEQDNFRETFGRSAGEWDYLMTSLLPFASYRLCQDIYPIRLNTSALLLGAYDKSDAAARSNMEYSLAQRFARLTTFLDFPSGLNKSLSRGQVTEFLFQVQKHAEAFGLRHF